jgi:hypothetical protein
MSRFFKIQDRFFKKKLKGGALYVAIMISVVIGILVSMLLLLGEYNQRALSLSSSRQQMYENLKSAFEMAHSAYLGKEMNGVWFKNQYNEDSIRIRKRNWGAYEVLCLQTKNKHDNLTEIGIYGGLYLGDTALLISENSRALSVSGNMVLNGLAYLPKLGIRPAYVEGQSFVSNSSNQKFIKPSNGSIPLIDPSFRESISTLQLNPITTMDSVMETLPFELTQPFELESTVFLARVLQLSDLRLKGNIILVANEIKVDSTCVLNNILLICDKIVFGDGFKGKVHVIANDSIVLGDRNSFEYPSSMILCPNSRTKSSFHTIQFGKDCQFMGTLLAFQMENSSNQKVFVKLERSTEFSGLIYSSDYLHLEGKLNAIVIADKLLLKTPSAVYENHLLSCEINPQKYKGILALPKIFAKSGAYTCCERLN